MGRFTLNGSPTVRPWGQEAGLGPASSHPSHRVISVANTRGRLTLAALILAQLMSHNAGH